MSDPWVPSPEPYVGSAAPIAMKPATFARHARAVERVLGDNNARYPRAGRGRTTGPSAGAWARLASGHTIAGGNSLSLGQGVVTLCSRVGANLAPDGEDVTVYNSDSEITASQDMAVRLLWTDGVWAVVKCDCDGGAYSYY